MDSCDVYDPAFVILWDLRSLLRRRSRAFLPSFEDKSESADEDEDESLELEDKLCSDEDGSSESSLSLSSCCSRALKRFQVDFKVGGVLYLSMFTKSLKGILTNFFPPLT